MYYRVIYEIPNYNLSEYCTKTSHENCSIYKLLTGCLLYFVLLKHPVNVLKQVAHLLSMDWIKNTSATYLRLPLCSSISSGCLHGSWQVGWVPALKPHSKQKFKTRADPLCLVTQLRHNNQMPTMFPFCLLNQMSRADSSLCLCAVVFIWLFVRH